MTSDKTGGPAFPRNERYADGDLAAASQGMTLRDYFAGQALAGLLADPSVLEDASGVAYTAYIFADAMIAARKEAKP